MHSQVGDSWYVRPSAALGVALAVGSSTRNSVRASSYPVPLTASTGRSRKLLPVERGGIPSAGGIDYLATSRCDRATGRGGVRRTSVREAAWASERREHRYAAPRRPLFAPLTGGRAAGAVGCGDLAMVSTPPRGTIARGKAPRASFHVSECCPRCAGLRGGRLRPSAARLLACSTRGRCPGRWLRAVVSVALQYAPTAGGQDAMASPGRGAV